MDVELQRPRDRVQNLCGRVDLASLLEPRVPGDAYPGELRHLLAPKARGPPPAHRAKPDLLGLEALAAAAQEGAELAPAQRRGVRVRNPEERGRVPDGLERCHTWNEYC